LGPLFYDAEDAFAGSMASLASAGTMVALIAGSLGLIAASLVALAPFSLMDAGWAEKNNDAAAAIGGGALASHFALLLGAAVVMLVTPIASSAAAGATYYFVATDDE